MSTDYQQWYVRQTYGFWKIPLLAGGVADDISSVQIANFTLWFRNTSVAPPVDTQGTGTFYFYNSSTVLYKPSPSDVAAPFSGQIVITAGFPPSGGAADLAIWDPISFTITSD